MPLDLFDHADEEPLRPGPDPESEASAILAEAVERWNPLAVVALFSGGNDSTCAARIAAESPRFAGCLLADTGMAIPEAHDHARATAARFGWPLIVERTPEDYETLVLAEGFSGPAKHWQMYQRLKERAFQAGVQRVKRGRPGLVVLVGWRRRLESPRRLRRLITPVEPPRNGGVTSAVFASPLFWWTSENRDDFQSAHGLPPNPVTAKLCSINGDCCCGAMADQGPDRSERRRIAHFYPEMDRSIAALERRAFAAGVWYQWGVKPPPSYCKAVREQQHTLMPMYGCTGCEWRAEAEEDARALDFVLATEAALQCSPATRP